MKEAKYEVIFLFLVLWWIVVIDSSLCTYVPINFFPLTICEKGFSYNNNYNDNHIV